MQWTRILNLLRLTKVDLKLFTEKRVNENAFSPIKRISIDQNRFEFDLNVSRAYIKLLQTAK
jgi:hypothetical protein